MTKEEVEEFIKASKEEYCMGDMETQYGKMGCGNLATIFAEDRNNWHDWLFCKKCYEKHIAKEGKS
jgi:hypothetical protein